MVERLRAQGITDSRVLHAIGVVPRHIFLEPALANVPTRTPRCRWDSARPFRSPTWLHA